jgi:translation initiation factor 2 alpha subunit (eIF-2alpha)
VNIPTKIKIKKVAYSTQVVESLDCKRGEINFTTKTITIAKRSSAGFKYSKRERAHTLLHEILHATLKELNHKQYADEKFVGPLAEEIASALEQCGVRL